MKKVFKASLVAAALTGAFAANAAQIISTPLKLSSEGIQAGETLTTTLANFKFDVKVDKTHASGSEIVLTFTDGLDLTGVTGGACGVPASGVQTCGDVQLSVGNGNFTFDNVAIDEDEGTVTFNVQLGNAITPESAFRVAIQDAELSDAVTVSYASNLSGTAIESTSKSLTAVENQFSYSVKTKLDQEINRGVSPQRFVDGTTDTTTNTDKLVLTVKNNDDLLLAATAGNLTLELGGNFKDGNGTDSVGDGSGTEPWSFAGAGVTVAVTDTKVTVTVPAAIAFSDAPDAQDHELVFTKQIAQKLLATSFDITAKQAITGITDPVTYVNKADAGKWAIDATIINVPYLPVGYAQFSPVVEVSNLGGTDAEIIVSAVGKTGKQYAAKVLSKKAAKNAVTSIFEADLFTAFGLAKGSDEKLSVTFSIDADEDNVTLVPYYREGTARVNVLSDQYKK